ncbi:MAG TPA: DMT family transporter [Vicinamibacteria bacterium]|nr:DMT family transporter [Vicinamibacteria bacterium]
MDPPRPNGGALPERKKRIRQQSLAMRHSPAGPSSSDRSVSFEITVAVLVAAAMHAFWNTLVKTSADRLVDLASLNLCAGLIGLALVPFVGFPGTESLPYLAGTIICHAGYYTFLVLSYSVGGLSVVYPIARGASPLVIASLSAVLIGEPIEPGQILGVGLLVLGIALIAFGGKPGHVQSRAVVYALATGVSIAAYTLTDGAGARVARTPLSYTAALFALNGLVLIPAVALRRSKPRVDWKRGAVSGALSVGAYGLVIWAMTRANIALVAALRETSVVMAALIGTVFLGEPFGRYRIGASLAVAAGIVLLRLSA